MTNNEYEKAKEDCWRDWTCEEPAEMSLREFGEARKVFDYAFDRAYQLGKVHAAKESYEPIKTSILQIPEPQFIPSVRLQLAGMAMQGFVANGKMNSEEYIAKKSVAIADALLNELNKEKNG